MNRIRTPARLLLVLALSASLAGCGINTIPTQDEAVKAQWGEVQNQYQRRSDLIPNLVATVKGYAAQESNVLIAVTQARASATQVPADSSIINDPAAFQRYQQAQNNLSTAILPLRVLQEAYPDLKSNTNFMALQSQIEGTENRIAIARRDYNEAARQYNTTLRSFPQNIWAATVHRGQKPANLFGASAQAQTAPTVDFSPAPGPSGAPAPVPQSAPPSAPK
jgi:LemA protein